MDTSWRFTVRQKRESLLWLLLGLGVTVACYVWLRTQPPTNVIGIVIFLAMAFVPGVAFGAAIGTLLKRHFSCAVAGIFVWPTLLFAAGRIHYALRHHLGMPTVLVAYALATLVVTYFLTRKFAPPQFHVSARTLFVAMVTVAIPLAWVGYSLDRIRERWYFLRKEGVAYVEGQTRAPVGLWLFGEKSILMMGPYPDRQIDFERARRLFPEAQVGIWRPEGGQAVFEAVPE